MYIYTCIHTHTEREGGGRLFLEVPVWKGSKSRGLGHLAGSGVQFAEVGCSGSGVRVDGFWGSGFRVP